MRKLILLLLSLTIPQLAVAAQAPLLQDNMDRDLYVTTGNGPAPLYLAADDRKGDRQPEPGELVIPGQEENQGEEKRCLTVCKNWGEDCIINPRTGARKCRRTCKEFGEECF